MDIRSIMDKIDRITTIASEVKSPRRRELVHFRGKMEELPVVRLTIDLPIYRMKNGRTQVEQYQYVEEAGHSADFFECGEEDLSVQRAQHRILLKLAKDDKGPIYQEMERIASQRESLLLTSDGVVVNGNRRLAAMRDLFARDARSYSGFSHIDAVILPLEANAQDLELLEAELQMAPETKLEYGWIERRLKLRLHVNEMNIPRDKIRATYRFRREEEINIELQQLALAEEYLETYLGRPRAYREVGLNEQLFKNLEKELRGKSGIEAEVRRLIGYLLTKESRNFGDRVYHYNPIFGREFDKVMTRFSEEEGIDLTVSLDDNRVNDKVSDEDPLDGLNEDERCPFEALKPILEDQEKTKETSEKLSRVFDSIKDEAKEEDIKQAALKSVQKVNRILHEVDLSKADPNTLESIKAQLAVVISTSEDLKLLIGKLSGSENGGL